MTYMLLMISDYSKLQMMTPEQAQSLDATVTGSTRHSREPGLLFQPKDSGSRSTRRPSVGRRYRSQRRSVLSSCASGRGLRIIEAASIDEAADWATKVAVENGAIEVRQVL